MEQMITVIGRLALRDEGQDLMEYGLLAALIAIVAIKRMGGFSLAKLFNDVAPARGPQKQQAQPYRHLEVKP